MSNHRIWRDGVLIRHEIDGTAQAIDNTFPSQITATTAIGAAALPWPLALLPLKLLAHPGDRGAGDIIARTIGPIGGDAFKKWYKTIFGKSCGCGARVDGLNARYPLL